MPVGRLNQISSDKPGQTRTVFRPPWVKESESTSTAAPGATKTTPPWAAKKTTSTTTPPAAEATGKTPAATPVKTPAATAVKTPAANLTKTPAASTSTTKTTAKTPVTNTTAKTPVTNTTTPSKVTPSLKSTKANGATAANPTAPVVPIPIPTTPQKTVKLQSREIKVPVMTEKPKPLQPILKPVAKDQKITKTPEQIEKELEEKFKLEKPKLRPVVMKTKSYAARKEKEAAEAAAAAALAAKEAMIEEESSEEEESETDEESDEEESEEEETEEDEKAAKARFKMERPQLRHVVINKQKSFNKSVDEFDKIRPVLKKVPKVDENKPPPESEKPIFKDIELKKVPAKPAVPVPPPPPPPSGFAPPPPPPPIAPPIDFSKTPLTDKQKKTLDKLKSRPRRRPDWSDMMKEVEGGRKLKHVQCNDRSKPILTCKSVAKVDGQFVFETEKENKASDHNKMLKEIQGGIKLKPTKTNDRSKPILEGLRKFRRQMTIEEQIQKSESKAQLNQLPTSAAVVEQISEDEMDDIDKLRDDLQSTKQMLALELRNKEAQERENKRLISKIANLEAELENEKQKIKTDGVYGDGSVSQEVLNAITKSATDENLVKTLKKDAEEARKESKLLEKKYQEAAEQLDQVRGVSDEHKRKIIELEKKLSLAIQGLPISTDNTRRQSTAAQKESSPELELEESESEEDEDEEKKAERKKRRLGREVKFLRTKLTKLLDKEFIAKKERANLKEGMKKNQSQLKQENKKFKKLEKEVGKMAASMAGDDDDEDKADENGEDEAEEEEEGAEESEEESESEESEEESESETESESEPEDASDEDKKSNLEPRVKRHEGRLAALKKGNFLLQTNVDRLQDEINIIREKAVSLQAELDAVIADLGF